MTEHTETTKQLQSELEKLREENAVLQKEKELLEKQLQQRKINSAADVVHSDDVLEAIATSGEPRGKPPIQRYSIEQLEILSQIAQQMKDTVILTDADNESRIRYVNDAFTDLYGYEKEEVIGKPSWILFAGDAQEKQQMRRQRKARIQKDDKARLIYQDLRKDGTPFWVANTLSIVQVGEKLYDLGIVRDISARKQTEDELQHRTAELEALRQVGMELTEKLELDTLMTTIVERAVELIGGRAGIIGFYDPQRDLLTWDTVIGEATVPQTSKRSEGLAGQIWATRKPIIVDNYDDWDKQIPNLEQRPITAVVGAPIIWGDTFLGVLEVEGWAPCEYDDTDAELLAMFANQAAAALHTAQLFQAERKQRETSEALASAALAVSTALDLDQVLEQILEQVARVVTGNAFNIMFISKDDQVRVLGARGYDTIGLQEHITNFQIPLDESIAFKEIMENGEPIVYKDVTKIPGWVQVSTETYLRAYMAAPIQIGDEIIGFLNVDGIHAGQFDEEDAQQLQAFANHVSVAIANAQLFQAEREQRKMAETLAEAALTVSSALDLEQILDRILEQVSQVVKGDAFNITFIKEDEVQIVRSRGYEALGLHDYSTEFRVKLDESVTFQQMQQTGEPFVIADVGQIETWADVAVDQTWLHSYVGAPIQVKATTVGFVNVDGCQKHQFDEEDARRLQVFANHVSVAIEHARLFQAEREQRKMAEALTEAAFAMSNTLNFEQVLDRILENTADVVSGDAFNIMLVEDGIARVARSRGYERFGTEAFVQNVAFPISQTRNLKEMDETGEPLVISNIETYEGWSRPETQPWLRSYVAAPIKIDDETVGYLNVDSAQPNQFNAEDAHNLQVFTNYVATGINNARLFNETQRHLTEMEALQRVTLRLTSTLDLSAILDTVTESVLSITQANDCHIFLYDEKTQTFTFGAALWEDGRREPFVEQPRPNGLTATIAKQGQPLIIDQVHQHPLYADEEAQSWGLESIAGFPLKWRDRILGALTVAFVEPHTFAESEIRVLSLLADQTAIAIENAQLHRQVVNHATDLEARVAERTQQLQTQYARIEAILNNTSDGLVVTNEAGEIIRTNPVAKRLLNKLLAPAAASQLHRVIQNLGQKAKQQPEQLLEIKGLDLQLKATPIAEESPEGAAVVNIHDITHLNAVHRTRAQFITNISHELRTPATTIKLYADLLRSAPREKWDTYLDALATEAQQQAKLVEDILHLSRIDAGRLTLQSEPLALNEITENIIARHEVHAQQSHLTLTFDASPTNPIVLMDRGNFELVISNLLRNAIQYTPEGGRVTITTGEAERIQRTWATLTVKDTGIGISEEELPHIFERFFRGAQPQDMQISGTGLGLAIVKQIVELQGGLITVESAVDQGSTFTIWMPIAETEAHIKQSE